MGMTDKSLCDSCTNIGCEFQSGIVRTKCAFYMPPQLEPDNCGNYVVQDSTTKNDIRDNRVKDELERVKDELERVKDELEPTTKNDLPHCQHTDEEIAKSFIEDVEAVKDQLHTKNDLGVDCIDRAQAQTEIEMNASRYTIAKERGGMGQVEWSDQLIKISDAVDIIRTLPPVTPQEPNWIKCSEHLPNFDVDVLATTKEYGDVVKVTRWRTILKDCGWEWVLVDDTEGNVYNSDEIIAWMPLPEPYKAESEDKE